MQAPRAEKVTAQSKHEAQARKLREIRDGLGITREEMAKQLRLQYSTLKNAELGITKLGARAMEDAERLRTNGLVAEDPAPYGALSAEPDQRVIQATLNLAQDPTLRSAAKAMGEALKIPEGEALAVLIREKLRRG